METTATHQVLGYVVPTGVGRGMPDAISQVRREQSDKVVRFTTVGRLTKEKCLDVLVQALRRAGIPGSELVIVGDGDQRPPLKMLTAGAGNIGLRGHLRSLGAIAYKLVNSDVFMLASRRFDSQALVLSEAVAAGLPILYCDDHLTMATSPESAPLTELNISSLAAGTWKLADPGRRAAIRSASRGLLGKLTPQHTVETYISIYEELIRAKSV